jgi:sortase A
MARPRPLVLALALLLAAASAWQLGGVVYLWTKAAAADLLLARAWQRTLSGEAEARPWPWADTWPIARLVAPRQRVERYVLAGASGRNLAFAPGHVDGTALPGMPGRSVIAAHRDGDFAFLKRLAPGDPLRLQTADGRWQDFVVAEGAILDTRVERLRLSWGGPSELVLLTCYPFDALTTGGPLRYVLRAVPAAASREAALSGGAR